MAYEKIVRTKDGMRYGRPSRELDVRHVPRFGKDLQQIINESAQFTQKFIIQEFPNWLILTHKQFVSMLDYTEEMMDTKDRMFIAADERGGVLCVMEVDVDMDVDPVQWVGEDTFGSDWESGWDEGEEVPDRVEA